MNLLQNYNRNQNWLSYAGHFWVHDNSFPVMQTEEQKAYMDPTGTMRFKFTLAVLSFKIMVKF